jgi:hypothetical protein
MCDKPPVSVGLKEYARERGHTAVKHSTEVEWHTAVPNDYTGKRVRLKATRVSTLIEKRH